MPGELEALERLLKSVVIDIKTGCWLYEGPLDYKGYAKKYRRKGVINASASCGAHSGADKNNYQE